MGVVLAALLGVHKHYGDQVVLDEATLELRPSERIALIGRNGSGKSTILRLLAGRDTPEKGSVFLREDVVLGMLEQDPVFDEDTSVQGSAERAFADLDALEARLSELEAEGLQDPGVYERWEDLHETFMRRGGYERRARRDAVLYALGFRGREGDLVRNLSGGEKTRLGLARLLMMQPDILLLDEPTNHLDMDMRAWLEGYLTRYPGAAVLVSHDRAFLDGACGKTAEISRGTLRSFDGAPTAYREHRAEQRAIEERTRANQEKEAARLEAAASQMKKWAGQNAKLHRRAKSMEKRLDRYEAQMVDGPEDPERTTRFRFASEPSADLVLQAEHLTKRYDVPLFEDVSLVVRAGERIGLVGPNGAGKTTFLRTLLGETASDDPRGQVRFGSRVRVGYYDQELGDVDPDRTLIEEMIRLTGDTEAHNLLGRFMFPYDAQYKKIRDLSGGERARLALLKLVLAQRNLLVLDEPTNHLDVEMIEVVEAALEDFAGTLILVSHDRRFLEALVDRVWEVRDGRLEDYEGDFGFYLRKRGERRAAPAEAARVADRSGAAASGNGSGSGASAATAPGEPGSGSIEGVTTQGAGKGQTAGDAVAASATRTADDTGRTPWQLRRDREELEERIAALEGELEAVTARLAATADLTPDEIAELGEAHATLDGELIDVMARWDEVVEALGAREN